MMVSSKQSLWRALFFCRIALLGFACLAVGCKRERISVYTVPKETSVQVAEASEEEPSAPMIQYKTPAGWTEQPAAGGMRVAAFSIQDQKGKQIEVSVVPLPQIRASKADVVNLWREQLGLARLGEDEASRDIQSVKVGSLDAELFDIVSDKPAIEGKDKGRVVVAMVPHAQRTWFFKMSGEDESVRAQTATFIEFLKSVEFRPGHDAGPGRFTSTNVKQVPAARGGASPGVGGRPDWQVPAGWEEVPPPQMLLAKFVMPDKAQPKAEITVSVFPGDAGGVLQNVNRWRRQIKLDPVREDSLEKMTTSLDLAEGKAILVDLSGENPTNGQPTRIIGAILSKGDRTWFYKLMGQEQVAAREKAAFIKFVQTAMHPNG